ncbi:class I SAM-dependent methyltransferase [Saccharopolyspora erythraea]|uniref:mycofactocin oligosaccharide methyltransferase MftM n=1 Tax=Saccharopolyspora erythraea TaxID=1836 RepID=UPI001BA8C357|nr:mycofactocin oligosaccharide methyltransferase MftM [Saccharopolyspora erythraea]QUH04105.1 class I SAM-dependent methyltransferase [Saccharopolyspora erythraea]
MTDIRQFSGSAAIDPLANSSPGCYRDEAVVVLHEGRATPPQEQAITRTPHFSLYRNRDQVLVSHRIAPQELDNDVAGKLADELFAPGWLSGAEIFERVFTGVVRSTVDDAISAWSTFYRNTLGLIRNSYDVPDSSISAMVPVYSRVLTLVPPGRVLDVGSCFGFLALLLAERPGTRVVASDIANGTVTLLRAIARELGLPLGTLICDGARVPLPDQAVDTVTVIHLLEHLERDHGEAVLAEAIRLARRRVVVAVPFEEEPTAAYGHVRTFDSAELHRLGMGTGQPYEVCEHHGGWLVVDCS